jgi:receptor protein-tyrosine kinase
MSDSHFHSSLFPSDVDIDLADPADGPAGRSSTKRSIGAILIDAGVLSIDNAHRVIELQREKKIRFGEAAIELGLISEGDIRYALSYQYQYSYLPRSSGKYTNEELVAAYKPFSHEVDQLRAIRSQLMLRWFDKAMGHAMLAIVGAGRGEGGSYLAANLAIVFAQMGERTLLIDADMRAPRQHTLFQLNNQLGFSSLLAGRSDVASAVMRIPYIENLDVLPAGPTPPNPQELLNRPTLTELFQYARKAYDIVLIDTSSLSSGADAMIVAARAGAALAVARANETKMAAYSELIAELKRSGINVVGSVLNNPPLIDVAS